MPFKSPPTPQSDLSSILFKVSLVSSPVPLLLSSALVLLPAVLLPASLLVLAFVVLLLSKSAIFLAVFFCNKSPPFVLPLTISSKEALGILTVTKSSTPVSLGWLSFLTATPPNPIVTAPAPHLIHLKYFFVLEVNYY